MENLQNNSSPQLNILNEYNFEKTIVLAGISPLGEMIAIKPICENLGIDRKWQQEKIKNDPQLGSTGGMVKVIAADGKYREMYCLPTNSFQTWIWTLTATENINIQLWEEYKKGLVIYLLEMLKISLDEVLRLRSFESKYKELKEEFIGFVDELDEGKELSRQAKEKFKNSNDRKKRIFEILHENDKQLKLF